MPRTKPEKPTLEQRRRDAALYWADHPEDREARAAYERAREITNEDPVERRRLVVRLCILCKEQGRATDADRYAHCAEVAGRPVSTTDELTVPELGRCVEALKPVGEEYVPESLEATAPPAWWPTSTELVEQAA
jgi:hypothetical protein